MLNIGCCGGLTRFLWYNSGSLRCSQHSPQGMFIPSLYHVALELSGIKYKLKGINQAVLVWNRFVSSCCLISVIFSACHAPSREIHFPRLTKPATVVLLTLSEWAVARTHCWCCGILFAHKVQRWFTSELWSGPLERSKIGVPSNRHLL